MSPSPHSFVWATLLIVAVVAPHFTAQPPTAERSIEKDRTNRQTAIKSGKKVATTPQWGFFGTIFHLILEQINDTKSAYNQISDLVGNQFTDDNLFLNDSSEMYEWKGPQVESKCVSDRVYLRQETEFLTASPLTKTAVTKRPDPSSNGTTETPKISRTEFLKILDRNLKGLARLRNLEWREARKDSAANIRAYADEIFRGKRIQNGR